MYCVGLTGTIASGKSTVAGILSDLGVPVISADKMARELTKPGEPALYLIIQKFGESILTSTGELNRRMLRDLIFQNAQDKLWLEQLLHPLIRQKIEHEISTITAPYCIIEIPLLTDKKDYPYLNKVLLVTAKKEQQISRLKLRDKSTRTEASAILNSQADERTYQALADDIIVNDGSLPALRETVILLHNQYTYYARS